MFAINYFDQSIVQVFRLRWEFTLHHICFWCVAHHENICCSNTSNDECSFRMFLALKLSYFFVQNSMFIARNSLNSWRKFISSIYDYCYLSNGFEYKLVVIQQLVPYCVCVFAYLFVLLLRCVDFALFSSHCESIMMANFMVDIYMSFFIFPYMNFVFRVHYLYLCSRKKREYGR